MKTISILCILIVAALAASAQNYQCVQAGIRKYFISDGGLLKGIRIDSTNTVNGNLVLYPFRTPRGAYDAPSPQLDTTGGSWLGKAITIAPDGTTYFDTYWGDTVVIRTQAGLNENWVFYNDSSSRYYLATVIAVDTMTVLNTLDSVKTIHLTPFDGPFPNYQDDINNKKIVLSKNHGFARLIPLHTFPYRKPGFGYGWKQDFYMDGKDRVNNIIQSYTVLDYKNPDSLEIYDFNVGDVFERSGHDGQSPEFIALDSVLGKTTVGTSVQYTIRRREKRRWPANPPPNHIVIDWTFTLTIPAGILSVVDTTLMPEEKGNIYTNVYWPPDSSRCFKSTLYSTRTNDLSPEGRLNNFEPCGSSFMYKSGFGVLWHGICYDPSGNNPWSLMNFSVKNGQPCGLFTPVDVSEALIAEEAVEVYPVPASDKLYISYRGGAFSYSLISLEGRELLIGSGKDKVAVAVSAVPTGVYLLRITELKSGVSAVRKVVIAR